LGGYNTTVNRPKSQVFIVKYQTASIGGYLITPNNKREKLRREEGVWSWRKGVAVCVGVIVNAVFGAMRIMK
jgi:hypothetical protein